MKTDQPKVSIIIPVFNGGDYLNQAIDSALAQTYKNVEIIVVNDGSDDEGLTESIALSYRNKIRYFSKSNGGCGSALNLGIRNMTGDLFSWLSHDDIYLPRKVEAQVNDYLDQIDSNSIIFSGFDLINANSIEIGKVIPADSLTIDISEKPLYPLLRGLIHGCTLLIPKKLFISIGYFDESQRTTQDYALWFDFLRKVPLVYSKEICVQSRLHPLQDTQKLSMLHLKECNILWKSFIDKLSLEEKITLDGSEYNFLYGMSNHLDITPYEDAKNYAKKLAKNYIENIKVSVYLIINDERCTIREIDDSIQSILNQSHKNIELFIINCIGCIDEKISKLNAFNENIPVYIHSPWANNVNLLQTLKICIEQSTGKYSAFLVTPAIYSENKLELQIIDIERKNSYFSHTNFTQFNKASESFEYKSSLLTGYVFPHLLRPIYLEISTTLIHNKLLLDVPDQSLSQLNWSDTILLWLSSKAKLSSLNLSLTNIYSSQNRKPIDIIKDTYDGEIKRSNKIFLLLSTEFSRLQLIQSYCLPKESQDAIDQYSLLISRLKFKEVKLLNRLAASIGGQRASKQGLKEIHFQEYEGLIVFYIKPYFSPKIWTAATITYRKIRSIFSNSKRPHW